MYPAFIHLGLDSWVDWAGGDAGQAKPSFRQYYADCRTDIDQNKSISSL